MDASEALCPACAAGEGALRGKIKFCAKCGHRWLVTTAEFHRSVEQSYDAHYMGYRPDETFAKFASDFLKSHFIPRVAPPARLLDVGCGAGAFMDAAREAGYDVQGIDISEASEKLCRARGLRASAGDFLIEDFNGTKFDVITMWDVVEHLREPEAFFARAKSLLTDRGLIFAKIPGFGELSVRVSAALPMAGGALLGAPDHVQYFDRKSLSVMLARLDLRSSWIDAGASRSPGSGGSLKRRLSRRVRDVIKTVSGDRNLYVIASA